MTTIADIRLLSYGSAEDPRRGVLAHGGVYPIDALLAETGLQGASVLDVLEQWDRARHVLSEAVDRLTAARSIPLAGLPLLPPVLYPRGMFFAGANYSDHVAEMAAVLGLTDDGPRKDGDQPWHFVGLQVHNLVGHEAPFALPDYSDRVDWEAEIGVVIGRTARRVRAEDAMAHVAGLTIINDVSARDWWRGPPCRSARRSAGTGSARSASRRRARWGPGSRPSRPCRIQVS